MLIITMLINYDARLDAFMSRSRHMYPFHPLIPSCSDMLKYSSAHPRPREPTAATHAEVVHCCRDRAALAMHN